MLLENGAAKQSMGSGSNFERLLQRLLGGTSIHHSTSIMYIRAKTPPIGLGRTQIQTHNICVQRL